MFSKILKLFIVSSITELNDALFHTGRYVYITYKNSDQQSVWALRLSLTALLVVVIQFKCSCCLRLNAISHIQLSVISFLLYKFFQNFTKSDHQAFFLNMLYVWPFL